MINETFPGNFIKIRVGEEFFHPWWYPFPSKISKSTSTRILMKFAGNVSFIIVMILSIFQDNCVTQHILEFSLNIGNWTFWELRRWREGFFKYEPYFRLQMLYIIPLDTLPPPPRQFWFWYYITGGYIQAKIFQKLFFPFQSWLRKFYFYNLQCIDILIIWRHLFHHLHLPSDGVTPDSGVKNSERNY